MPEPNHRPPWQIAEQLQGWAIWQLVEMKVAIRIECDACYHVARWSPADMNRRLFKHRGRTLAWIGGKLRCSRPGCRSNWVRISPEAGSQLGKRPEIWG
jgi:hypothetical protein